MKRVALAGLVALGVWGLAADWLRAEVVVAEDFYYFELTKRFGEGGGFTRQDYAGGQNGPLGNWGGRWVSTGDAIITDPAFPRESQRSQAGTQSGLSVNYLTRDYDIASSIQPGTPIYFGAKINSRRAGNQSFIIHGVNDPDNQIAIGFGPTEGVAAKLGTEILNGGVVDSALYHQLVGKLEINADGDNERLTLWMDPTEVETAEISVEVTADVIGGLGDFDGLLRLDQAGAGFPTYWDDVAIGTTWQDVTQISVPRLTLNVNRLSGATSLVNETTTDFDLRYYELVSKNGSLSVDDWKSLDDQNTSGGVWQENNSNNTQLIESSFEGSTVLGAGQPWDLGKPFMPGEVEDLIFRSGTVNTLMNVAIVEYNSDVVMRPGDLDADDDVDSNDLLGFLAEWTGSLDPGQGMASLADLDGDLDVDSADLLSFLAAWTGAQAAGSVAAGGSSVATIPEPGCGVLLGFGVVLGMGAVRRRGCIAPRRRARPTLGEK